MSGDYQVRALSRGLGILTCFTPTHPEQSLTEISRRLGLAKGTAARLLAVLVEYGFVERTTSDLYHPGIRLFELGTIYGQNLSIERIAHPFLEELARECRQTANLAILDQGQVVHIAVVTPQRPIYFMGQLGVREFVHSTGLGKALVAGMSPDAIQALVAAHDLPARTSKTITTTQALLDHLALIRARGFARDDEESHPGLTCIAAPVRDVNGATVAAVSVSGATAEFEATDYTQAVMQAAAVVSEKLGFGVHAARRTEPTLGVPSIGLSSGSDDAEEGAAARGHGKGRAAPARQREAEESPHGERMEG